MTAALALDEQSLDIADLSRVALKRELSLQQRPNWLLCQMMNLLEQRRSREGRGWSRPWNKEGVTTFRTHTHTADDADYFDAARALLDHLVDPASDDGRFVAALMDDPKRMCFTFYHNIQEEGRQYEGMTLSFGRVVPDLRSRRDRVDIVLEDARRDGAVDGQVDRVRVYVCPWDRWQDKDCTTLALCPDGDTGALTQGLYDLAVRCYHQWKREPERQWQHWSVQYIDYFGGRRFIPRGSSFT